MPNTIAVNTPATRAPVRAVIAKPKPNPASAAIKPATNTPALKMNGA
jgi:hypothetical protein